MLLPITFFSLGFISTALQVILLRQMAAAFGGHEMAWGIMLACWLLWVAAGSYLGGKILPRNFSLTKILSAGLFSLSFLLPFPILAPKIARLILKLPPGQIVGVFPITLAAFFITALPCLVLGLLFAFNAYWAQTEKQVSLFGGMMTVYWWEALGAAASGFSLPFLLYAGINDGLILFTVALLGATLALLIHIPKTYFYISLYILLISAVILVSANIFFMTDFRLKKQQWGAHQLKASLSSIYGPIDVLAYEEQISFYQNGLLTFSYPDRLSAEEAVHYALLQHPHPQRVLLVGNGLGGAVKEALQYPQLNLTYIELDPVFLKAAKEHLPASAAEVLNSPRLQIILGDARPNLLREKNKFDVIMLNLPGPANAQLNRFYTEEFFKTVKAKLTPEGIFFFKVSAVEDYWSPNLLRYLATLRSTLKTAFPEILAVPGESALFFAAPQPGVLTTDLELLSRRCRERNLSNQFVNPQLLPFRFRADRIQALKEKLDASPYEINRDLHPISYLYDSLLFSAQFGGLEARMMGALSQVKLSRWALVFLSLPLLIFLLLRTAKNKREAAPYLCLFANGLTVIAVEIILLLAFQIYYGYVHFLLGLLIALFMLGLFFGAWVGRKYAAKLSSRKYLIFLQGMLLSMPVCFWLFFSLIGSAPQAITFIDDILCLMMLLTGTAGGLHFAGFSHYLLAFGKNLTESPSESNLGGPYAADLAGSALGALMVSALLIPLVGIPAALLLLGGFNLVALGSLTICLSS